MDSIKLIDSEGWLSIVKDRPDVPDIDPGDHVALQEYLAETFEWNYSISLSTQGLTSDKGVAEKIAQSLSR